MRLAILTLLAGTLIGCGGRPTGDGGPCYCPAGNGGILSLRWTLNGGPPSTQNCMPYDHLLLSLRNDRCCEIQIEPIPCTQDHWQYQTLPQGPATVTLDAVNALGQTVLSGSARVTLGITLPATPTPIDLQ
jgi:hypothetical protein